MKLCVANGVNEITEVQIGFDGITIANAKKGKTFNLTLKDIYLALAKEVPSKNDGELIVNPYQAWNEINSELHPTKIEVLDPPPTSGTRDAFAELAMEGGCKKITWIKAPKKSNERKYKSICHTVREDGAYIEAGENDNLIVQKLVKNPDALEIFGFSFLDQNSDKVKGATVNGIEITFENIADGQYPVSPPLFLYVVSPEEVNYFWLPEIENTLTHVIMRLMVVISVPSLVVGERISAKRSKMASLIHFAIFQAQAAISRLILSPTVPLRKFRVNLKSAFK